MSNVNTQQLILPSNPADRQDIMSKMIELDGCLTRQSAERDYFSQTIKDLADKYQLPKNLLARFARDYHKSAFQQRLSQEDNYHSLVVTLLPNEAND